MSGPGETKKQSDKPRKKGTGPLFPADSIKYEYHPISLEKLKQLRGILQCEQGFCGLDRQHYRSDDLMKLAGVAPSHNQKIQPRLVLPIMWFGKMHYVSLDLFARDAAKFDELQWKDASFLADSIWTNRAIYFEWTHPRGFIDRQVAGVSKAYDRLRNRVNEWLERIEQTKAPDIKLFDDLAERVTKIAIEIKNDRKLKAEDLIKRGLAIQCVRHDFNRLLEDVKKYRDSVIKSGEQIVAGLETVEGTAFEILNIVPTITCMDWFRETIYKLGMLIVRAGARGAGGAIAYGTASAAWQEALGILQKEGVQIVVDVAMKPVNRLARTFRLRELGRDLFAKVVAQLFNGIVAYCRVVWDNKGKKVTRQQWNDIVFPQVAGLVGSVLGLVVPQKLADSLFKTIVKSVTEATMTSLITSYESAWRQAKAQNREITEVLLADLPGIIMRFFQNAVVGVFQRRASRAAEYVEQQRTTRGHNVTAEEAWKILKETDTGEFLRKGTVRQRTIRAIQAGQQRRDIGPLKWSDYNGEWREAGLDYLTAYNLRKYADRNNLIIISANPGKDRIEHTRSAVNRGATTPKPGPVLCKTADGPGVPASKRGLVIKPSGAGDPQRQTHQDMERAMNAWKKNAAKAFKAGNMLRQDGVMFHETHLRLWAHRHSEDKDACLHAIQTLQILRRRYHVRDLATEMSKVPASKRTGPLSDERIAEMTAVLDKAKIGYYSDLDLVEVVCGATGERRFMGNLDEKTGKVLQVARDNRKHTKDLNIHKELEKANIPEGQLADYRDTIQHGGNAEIVTLRGRQLDDVPIEVNGVHIVFPDGKIALITESDMRKAHGDSRYDSVSKQEKETRLDRDIREEIEKVLKNSLQGNYQEFHNRATHVKKAYDYKTNKYVSKAGPEKVELLPVISAKKYENGVEIIDERGLGSPMGILDVQISLAYRHMFFKPADVASAIMWGLNLKQRGWKDIEELQEKHGVLTGVDDTRECRNIVLAAVHWKQPIAEVLANLMRARAFYDELIKKAKKMKVWYEIYTAYAPVAVAGVASRIGSPKHGVGPQYKHLASKVSSFQSYQNRKFHAFSAVGLVPTYVPPPPPKNERSDSTGTIRVRGPQDVEWFHSFPPPRDFRPIRGLRLVDVWRLNEGADLAMKYVTTKADNTHVAVFTDPIVRGLSDR